METMGIKPNDQSYNHVMVAFAKNKNIEMVETLENEAIAKGLPPSVYRSNALILAYCKAGRALDAEKVLKEIKS